jgi:hypothetical protein
MKAFIQNTTFGLFLPLLIAGNLQAQTPTAENARERVKNAEQKLRLACGDEAFAIVFSVRTSSLDQPRRTTFFFLAIPVPF